ncbi:hypothetical protein [Kitasatospora sp. NPDC002965]|uniref:hypothetical protein n=1 Tax=Kitasatospora sp. NPDC002965 TaxID=3154775 RepID=UPI0033A3659D
MKSWLEEYYPEVSAAGALGAALKVAAERRACEVGPVDPASSEVRIITERGVVRVGLAAGRRLFMVGIHTPGFTWATGSTDDLGLLVEAVASWKAGMPLDAFESRFDFMELDEFARPLEARDPAPLQWSNLLSSAFYAKQWGLLNRVHGDGALRRLFPTVSHGTVRLRVDPMDGESRHLLVREAGPGLYELRAVGDPASDWVTVGADDVVARLRGVLAGDR